MLPHSHLVATALVLAMAGSLAAPRTAQAAESPKPPGGAARPLPGLRKLLDTPLRDTSISRGPDGTRWLKTSTHDPNPQHHSGLCAGIFGKDSVDHVGYEGMFVFKANGRYHLCCAENFEGRYSCTIATSTHLLGPYGPRYEALPHAGHNMLFRDERGGWWSTYFGSDNLAPWQERAGIFPVAFDAEGRVRAATP